MGKAHYSGLQRACVRFVRRAQLKGQFLMSLETSEGLLEDMGTQALASGSYCSPEEISKNIDSVSLTDVANVRLGSCQCLVIVSLSKTGQSPIFCSVLQLDIF